MAVRRSVARIVGALVVPAICAATTFYFGYFTGWGYRGLRALAATLAQLSGERQQYSAIRTTRERLEHRIALLRRGDPDMVQEVWRNRVLGGENSVVMVPRDR